MTARTLSRVAGRWGRGVCVAVAAAAVPMLASATAQADTIDEAIAASLIPIDAVQTAIAAADTASIPAGYLAILEGQSTFLSAQESIVGQIGALQESFTQVDPAGFANLDELTLGVANENLAAVTGAFLSALDDPLSLTQLSLAGDLFNADLSALGTDLYVIAVSATSELLGSLPI